jgi:hypothetical protein
MRRSGRIISDLASLDEKIPHTLIELHHTAITITLEMQPSKDVDDVGAGHVGIELGRFGRRRRSRGWVGLRSGIRSFTGRNSALEARPCVSQSARSFGYPPIPNKPSGGAGAELRRRGMVCHFDHSGRPERYSKPALFYRPSVHTWRPHLASTLRFPCGSILTPRQDETF